MKQARVTICEDCKYRSFNFDREDCSKCGGKLEILMEGVFEDE